MHDVAHTVNDLNSILQTWSTVVNKGLKGKETDIELVLFISNYKLFKYIFLLQLFTKHQDEYKMNQLIAPMFLF